jgi:hypothetical protein
MSATVRSTTPFSWDDARSLQQLEELGERYGHDELHRRTGRGRSTTQAFSKLLWLVEHEPDIAKHAFRFMDVHGFLVQRLTGRFTTSLASADSFGLTDMAEETWATDLITGIGLRPEQFCDTVQPGETIGEVTGEAARSTGLPAGQAPARGARERLDPDRVHGGGRDGGRGRRRCVGCAAGWPVGVARTLLEWVVDGPATPQLQQALDWVGAGRPIHLYLPP